MPEEFIPVGGGSNILIDPKVIPPLIKVSPKFCEVSVNQNEITCSAGLPLSLFLKSALQHNLSGLEFATGVPATMGGMVYMNFECWGNEISQYVHSVFIYDQTKKCRWVKQSEYQKAYRWTSFHNEKVIILAVKFKLNQSNHDAIKSKMTEYLNERKQKQPIMSHTFGSVFKNPLPKKAGQLIDQSDLKGHQVGGAKVSEIHANFFENVDEASFEDACQLIKLIQNKVAKLYNINLECEVQLIN
ncbi:MAG: UDP-N-acetylmuramate dehydrogenase [Candidatus Margulisiibacteriota bacterium]